jgi:hypothetical protein
MCYICYWKAIKSIQLKSMAIKQNPKKKSFHLRHKRLFIGVEYDIFQVTICSFLWISNVFQNIGCYMYNGD